MSIDIYGGFPANDGVGVNGRTGQGAIAVTGSSTGTYQSSVYGYVFDTYYNGQIIGAGGSGVGGAGGTPSNTVAGSGGAGATRYGITFSSGGGGRDGYTPDGVNNGNTPGSTYGGGGGVGRAAQNGVFRFKYYGP